MFQYFYKGVCIEVSEVDTCIITYQAHAERVIFVNTVEQGSQLQIRSLGPFSIELKNLHITIVPTLSD